MYGLTDNIVAGPAGHITAGPAGSFQAGPAGSFMPALAGNTPVSGAGHVPFTEAGHVPIDCTPATIPYRAPSGGGMNYTEGSTQSAIPGPSAHVPVSQASGGASYTINSSGGGATYSSSIGGGGATYSSSIGGGGGGGIGGAGASGGGGAGGAGGSGGGGNSLGGPAGVNYAIGGAGMNYMALSGPGNPPMELRVGQAISMATGVAPVTPSTEGFTVSPGGRTVPTPVGYVHPPPASRFHGNPQTHVAHHPVQVYNSTVNTEAYQGYKPSYVWQGRPEAIPTPPFLAGDYLKPSAYEPARVIFSDEKPGPQPLVDDTIGAKGGHITEVNNRSVNLDFTQPRSVQYDYNTMNEKNVTLDNSEKNQVTLSQPQITEKNTSMDFSQTNNADLSVHNQRDAQIMVEQAERVTNLFFIEGPKGAAAAMGLGGSVMARVA